MDSKLGQTYKHTNPMTQAETIITITRIKDDGTMQGTTDCGDHRSLDANCGLYMVAV